MNTNRAKIIKLIRLLHEEDISSVRLAARVGMVESTVRGWVAAFHSANLLHISEWGKTVTGNPCIPVYAWGEGNDAVRSVKLSGAERARGVRRRRRLRKMQAALVFPVGQA